MPEVMRVLAAIFCCSLLPGCASTFYSRDYDEKSDGKALVNGVIYYESEPYLATYQYSAYVKDEKSSPNLICTKAVQKYAIVYERGRKRVLISKPSQFSSTSFVVALNPNGTLASINAATTPVADKLFESVLSAAATVAAVAAFDTPPEQPLCNAAPVMTSFVAITDFSNLPFEK